MVTAIYLRQLAAICAAILLASCGDTGDGAHSRSATPPAVEMASTATQQPLLVLSSQYGLCVTGRLVSQRWQTYAYNDHSTASTRVQSPGGLHEVRLAFGAIEASEIKGEMTDSGPGSRKYLSGLPMGQGVYFYEGGSDSLPVDILLEFDEQDSIARETALELMRSIAPCVIELKNNE